MNIMSETGLANQPELRVAIAAILLFPLLPLLHVAFLALTRRRYGLPSLGLAFLCCLFCLFGVVFIINRGVQPGLSECVTGFSLAGFFVLGYFQVYSLAYRGFSLRIVMDVHRNGSLSIEECVAGYNRGLGMDWLIEDRLAGLATLHLIRKRDDGIELSSSGGRLIGKAGWLVKKLLKLGKAG